MSSKTYRQTFEEHQQWKSQGAFATIGNAILSPDIEQMIPECNAFTGGRQIKTASLPPKFRDSFSKNYDANVDKVGIIARLPHQQCLWNSGSIVFNQAQVNAGAFDHPCLPLKKSNCGRYAFCAQITSCGGQTLSDKYQTASQFTKDNRLWNYLVIDNHNSAVHTSMPALQHSGDDMVKLSYVNLDHGFWIEWDCLAVQKGSHRRLTAQSLKIAREAYALAESHRQWYGSPSKIQYPSNTNAPVQVNYQQGQRSLSGSSTGSTSSTNSSCGPAPAKPFNWHRQQQYHNSQYTNRTKLPPQQQAPVFRQPARKPTFNPMAASWRPVAQKA